MARQLRSQLEQEVHFDPLRDEPTRTSQTIHTPTAPPPAATPDPAARPDETDESKPA
jgi:hypothetical protein